MTTPLVVKGIVVYITKTQSNMLSWLGWLELLSGAVAALVLLVHGGDPFKK